MFQQLSLFPPENRDRIRSFHTNIQDSGFDYQELDIGDITFKGGQVESVHRWYRLTPSYSPGLVRFLLKEFGISRNSRNYFVLDPFSGRGTTAIECQKQGIKTVGIEINPVLEQVGNKSLKWDTSHLNLLAKYITEVSTLIEAYTNLTLEEVVTEFKTRIPIIHNVFRWWQKPVLKNLIICREILVKSEYFPVQDYLWLAVNKACLDCANIHRNHPTITFDDDHQRNIDVMEEIANNLKIIYDDLINLNPEQRLFSQINSIRLGNSTDDLRTIINHPVDFVITSPPYPNRYSYVHQTRPQLHFMEILDNVGQATEIDLQAVGGTWGRATSRVSSSNLV